MHHEVLTWDAPEYHHFDKSADWYWSLGIIAVSIAVLSIVFGNVLFSLFILLAAITVGLYAGRHPDLAHVELRPRGIIFNDRMYKYTLLDAFWVEEDEYPHKIILKSKKLLMPYIIIPIGNIHPGDVRLFLKMHLKEEEHHESVVHKMFEYFGF